MPRRRPDLIERRKARGLSQDDLAARCGVSTTTVKTWEWGTRTPKAAHRGPLAEALGWSLQRLDESLGVLIETGASRVDPELHVWAAAADPEHVLAHLTEQWHLLVRADNLMGPRHALAGVQQQLPFLDALRESGPRCAKLEILRLAAQYAESASWLHEDAGAGRQARSWAEHALHLARSGGHDDLISWGNFRRSQQVLADASPRTARDAAQRALELLAHARFEGRPQSTMRAALESHNATALAVLGDGKAVNRRLDLAHNHAERWDAGDARSGHGAFATPGYLVLQRAWCYTILQRPNKAVPLFEEGLRSLPAVYHRDRAGHLVRYAHTLRDAGQVDAAADRARQAWDLAQAVRSGRCVQHVRQLATSLRPHRKVREVAALLGAVEGH